MAAEAEANTSFTWKISPLSKLGLGMHTSEAFVTGGCEWNLVACVREDSFKDWVVSVFLRCCDSFKDGGPRSRFAKYVLTVAGKGQHLILLGEGKRHFTEGGRGWGFKDCIKPFGCSRTPSCDDDDTLVIHAHVASTERAIPGSGYYASYDDQEEGYLDNDWEDDLLTDSDYDPQEEDSLSSGSDEEEETLDAGSDELDRTEPGHQPNGTYIKGSSNLERLSGQKLAAGEVPEGVQTAQLSSHQLQVVCPSPEPLSSRARSTSSNLIAELSTLTCCNINSPASGNGSTSLLQQQRERIAKYLSMPLEDIHKTDSFQDVEQIANLVADHPSTVINRATLKELVSELKEVVPSTMSIIESSRVTETSMAWTAEDLEARLFHRHKQLGCLKDEVCRLAVEEKKLEGVIQPLIARKARVRDQKKSTADELEKASREASGEMEEMKETSLKRKRASEDRRAAEEKLDQLKTSWKALKQTLGF